MVEVLVNEVSDCKRKVLALCSKQYSAGGRHARQSVVLELAVEQFIITCENALNEIAWLCVSSHGEWLVKRDQSIAELTTLIDALNKLQFDVNVSNLVGSSVGIVGSALAVTGLILAPFTAGISLAVSVAGISVGTAGGLTSLGAVLAKAGIGKQKRAEIGAVLKRDLGETETLMTCLTAFVCVVEDLKSVALAAVDSSIVHQQLACLLARSERMTKGKLLAQIAASLTEAACGGVEAVGSTGGSTSRPTVVPVLLTGGVAAADDAIAAAATVASTVVRTAGVVLSAAAVALNVYNITVTSLDVSRGSKVTDSEALKQQVGRLEAERADIADIVANFSGKGGGD